jgi:hypothetical protein
MTIENRMLTPGTKLVATYKKQSFVCDVVEDGGDVRYRVSGEEKLPKSPSSAASAVMGGIAANGWRFWTLANATEPATAEVPCATPPVPTLVGKPPKLTRFISRTPNQKGVEEGLTKWYCASCVRSFVVPSGVEPEHCREGHPAFDEDTAPMA